MFPSVISVIQALLKVINKQGIFRLITFVSGFSPEVSLQMCSIVLLKCLTFLGSSNHKEIDYFFIWLQHILSKEVMALTALFEIMSALEWKHIGCSFGQFFYWLLLESGASPGVEEYLEHRTLLDYGFLKMLFICYV